MDSFQIFIDQSVGVLTIVKWLLMGSALTYLVGWGLSWDRRLLGGLALSALVFLLAGCSINEAPRTTQADALIAQAAANSQAQQAQALANSQSAQQAAQLAAQAQQQQATALEIASQQAQTAQSLAQAQQAQANALQAQGNAQQAAVMGSAIVALDNTNARATERSTWLGWLLVAIVAGGLGIGGMAVYWRGRVALALAKRAPPLRLSSGRSQLTDDQLRAVARGAGYIEEQLPNGHYQIVNPRTGHLVSRHQLQLEASGPSLLEVRK